MNKVIFISQPMGGRSSDEINAERRRVIEIARQKFGKVDVLETFFDDFGPAAKPLDYLARALSFLQRPMWQSLLRAGRMRAAAALSTSAPRTTASP